MTDRQLTAALAGSATIAAGAPALRHSQPWRWVLRTSRLELYADAQADLSRDETLITCGGAVHRARIALAADGLAVRTDVLPDDDPQHVATLTPTGRVDATPEVRSLAEAARQEARARPGGPDAPGADAVGAAAPDPRAVTRALDSLVEAARLEGARLRPLAPAEANRLAGTTPLLHRSAQAEVARHDATVFAILYGDESTPQAWLRAGQALSAVDLCAARAGLTVVASASVVELARSRSVLRRLLPPDATPYLALRISAAGPPATASSPRQAGAGRAA